MSRNLVQTAGGAAARLDGPTSPGRLSVSAGVNVTFELLGAAD